MWLNSGLKAAEGFFHGGAFPEVRLRKAGSGGEMRRPRGGLFRLPG
jgi:hypothetical protein